MGLRGRVGDDGHRAPGERVARSAAGRQGRRRPGPTGVGGTRRAGGRPCDAEQIADDPTDALDLDAALDGLFAAPPDAFVAERNALVKQLRAAKRREEATAVAAMRKPARAVCALNHLALSDDPHLADLLDAIDAVVAADASTHREAVGALRDRIGDTVDAAVAAIEAPRSEDHPEITRALQAVAGDADALRLLVDGRLVDVPVGGMGALGLLPQGGADAVPRAPRPERSRRKLGVSRPPATEPDDEVEDEDEDARHDEVEEQEEGAGAEVDDSMAERRAARERRRIEKEVAGTRAAHEAAVVALERADGAVAEAEEGLAAADAEVAATEAALATARTHRADQAAVLTETRTTREDVATAEADARAAAGAAQAELDSLDSCAPATAAGDPIRSGR